MHGHGDVHKSSATTTTTIGPCIFGARRPVFENRHGLAVSYVGARNAVLTVRTAARPRASKLGATTTCTISGTSANCSSAAPGEGGAVNDLPHFHHLRLRGVEERDDRRTVDDLLHAALRDSLLRSDVSETVRPGAPELRHAVVVEEAVLRVGLLEGEFVRNSAVQCTSRSSSPAPASSILVRSGAKSRPGPWRSTAARASRQRAVVTLFRAEQRSWAAC